jgi:DnaK suppressor protein
VSGNANQDDIRQKLLDIRQELQVSAEASKQSSQVVELDQSTVGRLSRMDAMQAQAMSQASGRRTEELLRSVDAAIQRVDDGEYGFCQSCDEPIAEQRLAFNPAVLHCIECAEKAEQAQH